jgi:hypothetical protein
MVVANNEINSDKNTRQMLSILIAMQIWQCNVGRIAQ